MAARSNSNGFLTTAPLLPPRGWGEPGFPGQIYTAPPGCCLHCRFRLRRRPSLQALPAAPPAVNEDAVLMSTQHHGNCAASLARLVPSVPPEAAVGAATWTQRRRGRPSGRCCLFRCLC